MGSFNYEATIKQENKNITNITQYIRRIHEKCTADISIIPSMLVLNKIILNLTEIKETNKRTNKRSVETATDKNHTIFFFFFHHLETALDKGLAHMHFVDYLNSTSFNRERDASLQKC